MIIIIGLSVIYYFCNLPYIWWYEISPPFGVLLPYMGWYETSVLCLVYCYSCRRPPTSGCEVEDINTTVQVSYMCIIDVCHIKASIIVQVVMYIFGTLKIEKFQFSSYYIFIKLDTSKTVFMCFNSFLNNILIFRENENS